VFYFKSDVSYSKFFPEMFNITVKSAIVVGIKPVLVDEKLIEIQKYILDRNIEDFINNRDIEVYYISEKKDEMNLGLENINRDNYDKIGKDKDILIYTHRGEEVINHQIIEYLKNKAKEYTVSTIGILDLSKNEFNNFRANKLFCIKSGQIEYIPFSGLEIKDRFNMIDN
jgi:hypothetical protein